MSLPPPPCPGAPLPTRLADLVARIGRARVVSTCGDLLAGSPREEHLDVLPYLTGHPWRPGDAVRDHARWKDYWPRTWGARGLLHVWEDDATSAVLAGLADRHWRPVEMSLKVCSRHDVAGAGEPVASLHDHPHRRVRAQAARALGVVGDVEHEAALRVLLEDGDEQVRVAADGALAVMVRRLDLPRRVG